VRDLNFSNCERSDTARILVVEDDHAIRRIVVDYLEDHNMRGLSASGRQDLIRHCAAGEPDLIVLDLRLDQEDGLELLRETRSRSDVPVIIITGDGRDEIDRWLGWNSGPMAVSPSPSAFASFSRESGRFSDGKRPGAAGRSATQSCVDPNSAAGSSIGVSAVLSTPPDPTSR
jgi:CheY-like chemotaxis protein